MATTPDEDRQKFCFDQWQAGKLRKEINAALKHHPTWDAMPRRRKRPPPSQRMGKAYHVVPRSGQPGRRKSSE